MVHISLTSIEMKPSITLGLLYALFSKGAALTCYQCQTDTDSCTYTGTCSESCASITTNVYKGSTQVENKHKKGCMPSNECLSGSFSSGTDRITISTKCCTTDRCNSQETPEENPNTLNGKQCYICEKDGCEKTMSCFGNEDRCFTATVRENVVKRRIIKGCVSRSICSVSTGVIPTGLGPNYIEFDCCEGNLCNGVSVWITVMWIVLAFIAVIVLVTYLRAQIRRCDPSSSSGLETSRPGVSMT